MRYRYKDLCAQMEKAGWLSHTIVACNTDHREGSGQRHFIAKALLETRTGQAFQISQHIPLFDSTGAVGATIRYHDEHGWQQKRVTIDRANGLILSVDTAAGRHLLAYLSDIPPDRITYSVEPIPAAVDSSLPTIPLPDIEFDDISAREGSVSTRLHLYRERDRAIIAAKRRKVFADTGKLACSVCNFDFQMFYGELGADFCEIHHLRPLADTNSEVQTRLEDLAVVCSNCHRMIHRSRPFFTPEQLKSKIKKG